MHFEPEIEKSMEYVNARGSPLNFRFELIEYASGLKGSPKETMLKIGESLTGKSDFIKKYMYCECNAARFVI